MIERGHRLGATRQCRLPGLARIGAVDPSANAIQGEVVA